LFTGSRVRRPDFDLFVGIAEVRKIADRAERRANRSPHDGSGDHEKPAHCIVRKQQLKPFMEAVVKVVCE